MEFTLQKATKKKVKIKMAISSPTGFGKTYSALLLAYGITEDWQKIAVIDTENESASLYSDLGEYFTIPMQPPYNVDNFVSAVQACVKAGIEVIIIDSTYHYWHGKGGLLEYNNSLGGRYQDWAKTNPLYAKWLDTILQTPIHFICTSRKKQAYEMSKDSNGRTVVEKKGMEDQIRDGFDYEMTIAFNIISANHLTEASKDRTRLFSDKQDFVISSETGKIIKQWCESGIDALPVQLPFDIKRLIPIEDKALKAAIKRLSSGKEIEPPNENEPAFYDKLRNTYSFTDKQLIELNIAWAEGCKKADELAKNNFTPDEDPFNAK